MSRRQVSVPAEGVLQRVAAFLAAFGIGVAAYIAVAEADGGAPACLAGSGGCETVAASSHSELAGISVALIGVFGYALLLGAALLRGDAARMAGFGLGLIGLGYTVYLTWLELFVIEAICQWCMVSAVLMVALFAVSTARMLRYVGTAP
ncbi:MAG TPA: vitamin K epoxide reductase family protein [Solirubrobacterales bacterium]